MTSVPPLWTILVPVKATTRGKSRIDLPPEARQRLALAMALDTVSVAARCGRVLAVVEKEADAAALQAIPGVDVHLTTVSGLNGSILDGLAALSSRGVVGFIAVLPGDLPGLLAVDLAAALARSESYRFAVVADHQGVGTTLLAATDATALIPRYGTDSYRRHQEAGAIPVLLPATSSLRRDVDLVTDLDAALADAVVADPAVTDAVVADPTVADAADQALVDPAVVDRAPLDPEATDSLLGPRTMAVLADLPRRRAWAQ